MEESHDDEPSQDRWLVSYADFITLLFAFFTVLYATSIRDQEKTEEFQESVRRFLIKAGAFGGSGGEIQQGEKFNNPIESPIETYKRASPLTQDAFDEATEWVEQALSGQQRDDYVLDVLADDLGVRIILSADAIFDGAGMKFQLKALDFLKSLGGLLRRIGRRVLVEGHNQGTKLSDPLVVDQWEMGSLRASALARYFIKIHRMDPTQVIPMSYGSSRPWPGVSDPQRREQRRLEIVILTENLPF